MGIKKIIQTTGKDKLDDLVDIFEELGLPLTTGKKYQESLGKTEDQQTLNNLYQLSLRAAELDKASKNKKIIQQEEPEIDLFEQDMIQVEDAVPTKQISTDTTGVTEIENFNIEEVPKRLINIVDGEVKMTLGDPRSKTLYDPADIKMIITPRVEGGKNVNRVTFKLKDPPKTISEEEFFNFGVTAGKQDDTKNILDLYTSGKISKSEAAFQIQNIIPEIKNSKSLMYGNQKDPLLKSKSRFDKLYEGYISTLDDSDIMKSFPKFLQQETGQKQIQYDKIRQVKEVMNRLNDDDFLNIEFSNGTKMSDQPLDYQMYNAYTETDSYSPSHASYSNFVNKYLKPFYKFTKPDSELPNFGKPGKGKLSGKLEGTNYIFDNRKGPVTLKVPEEYVPYFKDVTRNINSFIDDVNLQKRVDTSMRLHAARMIDYAKFEGASKEDIVDVFDNINAEGLAQIFIKKASLESKIKNLKEQRLGSFLKQTNPELFPESIKTEGFPVSLIELSHIEDVAKNWKASFDVNNLFLGFGKFNRDQAVLDRKITAYLKQLKKPRLSLGEKEKILEKLQSVEQELVDKNLISKVNDTYFGAGLNEDLDSKILKGVEEAVDMSRYYKDGGFASIEEVLEY